jgi:hypothetical protein
MPVGPPPTTVEVLMKYESVEPPIHTTLTDVTPAGAVQEYVPGVIYTEACSSPKCNPLVIVWFAPLPA